MNKAFVPEIIDAARKALYFKKSHKAFSFLPDGLMELFLAHYNLILQVNEVSAEANFDLSGRLNEIKTNIEQNAAKILKILCEITNRKIIVHARTEYDTLWKISKQYGSNVQEISELNNIKGVFTLEGHPFILVPVKIL